MSLLGVDSDVPSGRVVSVGDRSALVFRWPSKHGDLDRTDVCCKLLVAELLETGRHLARNVVIRISDAGRGRALQDCSFLPDNANGASCGLMAALLSSTK